MTADGQAPSGVHIDPDDIIALRSIFVCIKCRGLWTPAAALDPIADDLAPLEPDAGNPDFPIKGWCQCPNGEHGKQDIRRLIRQAVRTESDRSRTKAPLPPRRGRRPYAGTVPWEQEARQMEKDHNSGLTWAQVGANHGVSDKTARVQVKKLKEFDRGQMA